MSVKLRQELERKIVRAIVKQALAIGGTVSVYDSEEWTVKKSDSMADIMGAIMTTDEDMLRIYNGSGERIGDVFLIYGNDGWDVISDHTDSAAMDELLAPAFRIADPDA
jgi:hypothetical protein